MEAVSLKIIALICLSSIAHSQAEIKNTLEERDGRLFGRPTLQLNSECKTSANRVGTCMRRIHCLRKGGTASGYCGAFGVCCEIYLDSGTSSRSKRTVIRSPPTVPRQSSYNIRAYSRHVCQIRIDFDLVLVDPNETTGMCDVDWFQAGPYRICGTNTNQHIYLPINAASGTADLALQFNVAGSPSSTVTTPSWNLVVTQLECPRKFGRDDTSSVGSISNSDHLQDLRTFLNPPYYDYDLLAPVGCLQYFTAKEGVFESFNYRGAQGRYMADMSYAICFARTYADSEIRFIAQQFSLPPPGTMNVDGGCHNPVIGNLESNDYLLVPNSVLNDTGPQAISSSNTYYCGTVLMGNKELIYKPNGPFVIYFNSDNILTSVVRKMGFRISYRIR